MTLSVLFSFMLHLNVVETIQATRITPFFFLSVARGGMSD